MADNSTPPNSSDTHPPIGQGWTTRRSQIAVLSGLGPSDQLDPYSVERDPAGALGSSDILILRYMEHNYSPNIPFYSWVHRTSLSNSLGFTNKTIKNRLTVLQDVFGLIEHHPEPGKQALYKLTTMGHALMQGQLSAEDAKIRKELGDSYHPDDYGIDAIVRREVTEIVNTRLAEFEERFVKLYQETMVENYKKYESSRADSRTTAQNNRTEAFKELTKELKLQFEEDRKFYAGLHEQLSAEAIAAMKEEIKTACATALAGINSGQA